MPSRWTRSATTAPSAATVEETRREAWHTYLGIDWQAAGMAPEAECRAFHFDYQADQVLAQPAWLAVAGGRQCPEMT